MKKYMVVDMVKDLRQDLVQQYRVKYNIKDTDIYSVDKTVNDLAEEYYGSGVWEMDISQLEYTFMMFYLIRDYHITSDEAFYLVSNWKSEADWKLVMQVAEDLDIGIEDVQEDDVWNMESAGSSGMVESSIGHIIYKYDILTKSFILYVIFNDGNPAKYVQVSKEEIEGLINSESAGKYYIDNIKGDPMYSDLPGSCGCIGLDEHGHRMDPPKLLCTAADFGDMPKQFIQYAPNI
jgi:hypothetical protein